MVMAAAARQKTIKEHQRTEQDTGSPEVQVALITERVVYLTGHLRTHPKDFHSRRGLVLMVSKRNRLLQYLSRVNRPRYQELIAKLGLRK